MVVPSAMRRELDLQPGDEVAVRIDGQRLVLERPDDLLREMQAELRGARAARSLVEELIDERRVAAAREKER